MKMIAMHNIVSGTLTVEGARRFKSYLCRFGTEHMAKQAGEEFVAPLWEFLTIFGGNTLTSKTDEFVRGGILMIHDDDDDDED